MRENAARLASISAFLQRRSRSFIFALSVLVATVAGALAESAQAQEVVRIAQGRLSGARQDGVIAYLGVPYAGAPVGELRWRAPQRAPPWRGVRAATQFGPSCMQNLSPAGFGPWTPEYQTPGPISEDCLTLNVWRPAQASRRERAPVLVWFHGGGFQIGSGDVPVYDGSAMARRGVVVVSVNYRLGPFGFFASPDFLARGGGNFGFQDQIAALRWVRRNIAAFGGDPDRVTISGQSAGAMSVHVLLLSPQARGLFQRAIPQSGMGLGLRPGLDLQPRAEAEQNVSVMLAALGVGSIEEARQIPPERILAARAAGAPGLAGFNFTPYVDGAVIPEDSDAALGEGRFNDTPVLIGMTAAFVSGLNMNYNIRDGALYRQILQQRFGALTGEAERLYPWAAASPLPTLLREAGYQSMLDWIEARAASSREPLYAYMFTHVAPGPQSSLYGAFHTSEVPYVFGALDKAPTRPFTEVDRRLSEQMMSYWINFIATGDPNGADLPAWPEYGEGAVLELGDMIRPYPMLSAEKRDLFRRHLANGGSLFIMR